MSVQHKATFNRSRVLPDKKLPDYKNFLRDTP